MTKLLIVAVILVILIAVPVGILYSISSHSTLTFPHPPTVISVDTPMTVRVANPHGVRHVIVTLEQNGASTRLLQTQSPADGGSGIE